MKILELLAHGRALHDVLVQAAETASRLNREDGGRLSRLASLTAQAAEEAEACFTGSTD